MNKQIGIQIKKSDNELRQIFGWAMISRDKDGAEVFDSQGDGIDPYELEQAVYSYVRFYRDMGEQHVTKNHGKLIESIVTTLDKQAAMGIPENTIPVGWWVGFQVDNEDVWQGILDGTYNMFSIEGTGERVGVSE